MLTITVCSFIVLMIERRAAKEYACGNLHKHAHAANSSNPDAFKLPILAQKSTLQVDIFLERPAKKNKGDSRDNLLFLTYKCFAKI